MRKFVHTILAITLTAAPISVARADDTEGRFWFQNKGMETRDLAAHKLQVIEGKLADLKAMRKALTALLHQCDSEASKGGCPIIHALAAD